MRKSYLYLAAATALAIVPAAASAGPVVAGFDSSTLARNDDNSVGPVDLGFSANFFGTTYTSTYVSNNGYVTFGAGQGNYVPVGLGAGYTGNPIIAAFYDDVDTRNLASGQVTYGTGTFNGHAAFGVNWPAVGYYSQHADLTNTFQELLVDRSDLGVGNFDIFLNYDHIGWDVTNDTSSAAVGYNAGTNAPGSYYQLNGSLVTGAFVDGGPDALVSGSNTGVAGRYEFDVRNGTVVVPPPAVPEPATWGMMILGFSLVGFTFRRQVRRSEWKFDAKIKRISEGALA